MAVVICGGNCRQKGRTAARLDNGNELRGANAAPRRVPVGRMPLHAAEMRHQPLLGVAATRGVHAEIRVQEVRRGEERRATQERPTDRLPRAGAMAALERLGGEVRHVVGQRDHDEPRYTITPRAGGVLRIQHRDDDAIGALHFALREVDG